MRGRSTLAALVLLVAPAVAVAQPSAPLPPDAKRRLDAGIALYGSGSYEQAAAEFEAGLRIADHADLWYALAQSQRKLGRCDAAIDSYRHFLKSRPPPDEAARAELNVKRCEEIVAKAPEAAETPRTGATATPPPVPPSGALSVRTLAPRAPRDEPTRAEIAAGYGTLEFLGVGVTAMGGLLIGVGAYFAVRAQSDWGAVNDAAARHETWSPDLQRHYESAESAETKGTVLFVAGGAAAAIGGVLFYLGLRGRATTRPVASVEGAARGGKVVVKCAF